MTTGTTKLDDVDPEAEEDIIVRAWDAVRRMDEALRMEANFKPVGMPTLTAQKVLQDLNRHWVVACMEAGRLMREVLEKMAKYEKLHEFDLTDNELELARLWATSHKTSRLELAHYFDVTPETMATRINKLYKKTDTKSRRELYYALKLKALVD
jgi:DNA-binding CsgD family transcriptional regulator